MVLTMFGKQSRKSTDSSDEQLHSAPPNLEDIQLSVRVECTAVPLIRQKAAGPDNIPGQVFRECVGQLAHVLTDIFNTLLHHVNGASSCPKAALALRNDVVDNIVTETVYVHMCENLANDGEDRYSSVVVAAVAVSFMLVQWNIQLLYDGSLRELHNGFIRDHGLTIQDTVKVFYPMLQDNSRLPNEHLAILRVHWHAALRCQTIDRLQAIVERFHVILVGSFLKVLSSSNPPLVNHTTQQDLHCLPDMMPLSMAFCKLAALCALLVSLPPRALCTTTRYFTYEEDAPGTEIGNLSRDLKIDPADDPDTSFRFMQENSSSVIRMREADGLLSVAEVIDRERLCPRSPRCFIAFDIVAFSREKFQLVHVEVEVKDINDHAPHFPRNETTLEISESAPLESRFALQLALDEDVGDNYIQRYNASSCGHFAVEVRDREDGVKLAELVLVRQLDREVEDSYTVEVTATDGGAPPKSGSMTVSIKVLDFNDNSPTFEHGSLKVELSEDSPVGHRVLRVHAFDPDDGINGEVLYSFSGGLSPEAARAFRLDPVSGDVTLRARVDYERKRSYELSIEAADRGAHSVPSTCRVAIEIVDVNDNAPRIDIRAMSAGADGVARITEAAAAESFVALISTSDSDSGSNGYVRVSLREHGHFSLRQAYGEAFMIATTGTLDREAIPEYNLTVVAEDLGSPPFRTVRQYTIRVTDENDNPPLFSKLLYDVSVLENNIPGSYIATVVARDPDMGKNAKVSYKLLDSEVPGGAPVSTYVSVDSLSGTLYSLRSFDYETLQQIELVIQAEDEGSPSLSSTSTIRIRVVDQNDNYPYFTFPVFVNDSADVPLPFNAPPDYLALRVSAEDEDDGVNAELSYQIVQGDAKLFAMNKDTGEIALKQWLTAEIGDVLEMKIAVSDNARAPLSSSATVRFVVSDTEPSQDQVVIVLRASDEDGSVIDGSLVIIIMLSGGCALLIIAIVGVTVTCKRQRGARGPATKGEVCLFESRPIAMLGPTEPNIYTAQRGFFHERTSLSLDDSCLYEERSGDSEAKTFLPSKHFQPASVWQSDKYCLQVSGIGNTDQLSVKDSGKGDSDFNDSDSDVSGDGGKKNFRTFQPRLKSAAHSLSGDYQGTYCAIQPQRFRAGRGDAYTIGFSPAPAFSNARGCTRPWKDPPYGTSQPKPRGSMQTFSKTRTLPSYFAQQQQHEEDGEAAAVNKQSPNFVTVATALEVATIF
ncbi:protocadherin-8 [Pholidichthys leucotaenia]